MVAWLLLSGSVFAVFTSLSVIVFRGRIFPLGGLVPAFTTTNPPNQHTETGSGITEWRGGCASVCVFVPVLLTVLKITIEHFELQREKMFGQPLIKKKHIVVVIRVVLCS